MQHSDTVLHVLSIVGFVAEAMTAALAAGRRTMDWMGVALLGCVTALGGGSVRDVLLGHHPLLWVAHPRLLGLTAVSALLTIAVARFMYRLRMTFLVLDAIGLVVFTILGCDVALTMQVPLLIVIVSGMITGCVGGVLRDVLCNDVPLLFRSELYASVSVVVGIIYVGGVWLQLNHDLVVLATLAIGLTFRLLAIAFKWEMPKFVYDADLH
ncbi:MAG: trimeric intracellular cation channel family protein [Xanthobacteraceae bacterium]